MTETVSSPRQFNARSSVSGEGPCVAVLLCTKDGERFLDEQLQSVAHQTHENWILYVSDDGSTDKTTEIIATFAAATRQPVILREGPQRGFCQHFLSLAADPSIRAEYFAFCDQDDIWLSEKLERALNSLRTIPKHIPALYGARAELITAEGKPYGRSALFTRKPSFENALVQNLAGGNTLVFNLAAKKNIEQAGIVDVVAHDWWVYQLVSAAGGAVFYDPRPSVKYRQHPENLIGSNLGWRRRLMRIRQLFSSRYRDWIELNLAALQSCAHLIQPANKMRLEKFAQARQSKSLLQRLNYLKQSGVYRQTFFGNLGLLAAVVFRKF